jgi:hypothetical protein
MGEESRQTVIFDYSKQELTFSRTLPDGKFQQEKIPMKKGVVYEDYLTLFYNFRHGLYGPLERGRTYRLPLQIHKGMNTLELSIAPREEEERNRQQELKKVGKDFFLRFRVNQEDVSSESGEIEGWISHKGLPTKGTIRDVSFFGDLWGELIQSQSEVAPQTVRR